MYQPSLLILSLLIQSPNIGQAPLHPSTKGLRLGVSKTAAIEKLGMPLRVLMAWNDGDIAGYGARTILIYSGARLTFEELDGGKDSLMTLEVWSPALSIDPGVRVGMTKADVIRLLGKPSVENLTKAGLELWFSPSPGQGDQEALIITLQKSTGRVSRIRMDSDFD